MTRGFAFSRLENANSPGVTARQDGAATAATVTFTDKPKAARQDGKLQITFAVDETHLYATDTLNQRLTRIKLDYAAEATCEVN